MQTARTAGSGRHAAGVGGRLVGPRGMILALVVGVAGGLGGCRGGGGVGAGVLKAHEASLEILPATTAVVVTLAPDSLSDELVAELDALLGVAGADPKPVRADLGAMLSKRLGFDPTRWKTLTVFMLGDRQDVGLLLPRGVSGPPAGKLAALGWVRGEHGGRAVLASGAVLRALKSAEGSAAKAGHGAALAGARGEPVAVVTVAGAGVRRLTKGPLAAYGIEGVVLSVTAGGGQRLAVRATGEGRKKMLEVLDAGVRMARARLTQLRGKLDELDPATAAEVIYVDHRFEALEAAFRPREEGDFLALSVPASRGAGLALAGVAAAVGIPAFLKYTRRAKTVEAIDELDKMYKGAAVYFSTPKIDQLGNPVPCQFPASVGPTPKAGTCCGALGGPDKDGDGQCDGEPSEWSGPTWSALSFQIMGPHRFVYAFESAGTGASAVFTASAYGDLDCDGVMSTFQRTGYGGVDGPDGECLVVNGPVPFFVDHETE